MSTGLLSSRRSPSFQFEDKAFKVIVDTYVTKADGTGIVHQAPAFGEDDHRIAIANGVLRPDELPPCPVDDAGRFTDEVPDFKGDHVKVCLRDSFTVPVRFILNRLPTVKSKRL